MRRPVHGGGQVLLGPPRVQKKHRAAPSVQTAVATQQASQSSATAPTPRRLHHGPGSPADTSGRSFGEGGGGEVYMKWRIRTYTMYSAGAQRAAQMRAAWRGNVCACFFRAQVSALALGGSRPDIPSEPKTVHRSNMRRASSRVNPSPIRSSLHSLLSFFACFEEPRLEQRLPVLCSLLPRAEVRHTCTPSVLCPGRPCCRPLLALLRRPRAALSTPPSPRPSTLAPPDA